MQMYLTFEISIDSIQSAINAERAGAQRVELCAGLSEGGTTPSIGMIKMVRKYTKLQMFVIIRPRGGDFLYSDREFDVMCNDILEAKKNGADGIVSGALTADGEIDIEKTKKMVELTYPLPFTFHRAFDMCKNPHEALEQLINIKVSRILTSGQKQSAELGIELLTEIIKLADERITIIPGAGINENNIISLIKKTKATEYHFSGKKLFPSKMIYINNNISMGGTKNIDEYSIMISDYDTISTVINKGNSYLQKKNDTNM